MKDSLRVLAVLLASGPLQAGTLDLTSARSATMNSGDTLSFELLTSSFTSAAVQFGLPVTPSMFGFSLITAPVTGAPSVSATLRSADASIKVALGSNLNFSAGYFTSAGYQGAVSTLQGQFHFDSQTSQQLFQGGSVWLELTDLDGSITLGLQQTLLKNDLFSSLSNGPLTVGALTGEVEVKPGARTLAAQPFGFGPENAPAVPEAASTWMLTGGGVLLCALGRAKSGGIFHRQ